VPKKGLLISLVWGILLVTVGYAAYKYGPRLLLKTVAAVDPVKLAGQSTGRTNFLIMGMTADGLRTDTIIIGSYYYKQNKLVTLNIPRDLYVWDGYENCKFGEVYAYAKARQPNNPQYPDQFLQSLLEKEYGISINYWAQFNMQGEVDFINTIGGININVPVSFTDYEYPTADYSGYVRPAPHFNAGPQQMDGATALIYSRSRHSADNDQGSDFARSKRQGQVIQATLSKVKAQGIVGNVSKLGTYLKILNQNFTTDMPQSDMIRAIGFLDNFSPTQDVVIANWSNTNGFICDAQTAAGADILHYGVPGDCTAGAGIDSPSPYRAQAVNYVQNLLQSATSPSPSASPTTTP
jgi:LCP family protein required for cell wall assembly